MYLRVQIPEIYLFHYIFSEVNFFSMSFIKYVKLNPVIYIASLIYSLVFQHDTPTHQSYCTLLLIYLQRFICNQICTFHLFIGGKSILIQIKYMFRINILKCSLWVYTKSKPILYTVDKIWNSKILIYCNISHTYTHTNTARLQTYF